MSNETEAVKLADPFSEQEWVEMRKYVNGSHNTVPKWIEKDSARHFKRMMAHLDSIPAARALLATPQAEPQDEERATNTGHGHVRARPDGVKERCGGPAMCSVCAKELAQLTGHPIGTDTVMVQSQDEERAAELYSACWKMFMPGSKYSRAAVEKHFAAEFAAIRAESAKGWPGTVSSCPACASTIDVEWAVCPSPDNVCPLKRAMAKDFKCPHCETLHDIGSTPDYLTDLGPSHTFNFECKCGATFDVLVEWDPVFYVNKDTLVVAPNTGSV